MPRSSPVENGRVSHGEESRIHGFRERADPRGVLVRYGGVSSQRELGAAMFRHVVMFRWSDSTSEHAKQAARQALRELPARIPEVREFRFGDDAGLADGNFDMVVVADFDDVEGYLAYAKHPAHLELVADHLRPHVAERAAVQHTLGDV